MNSLMLVFAAALTFQGPGLPKKEFFDAIETLHAELKDFEFEFEGRVFVADAVDATEKRKAAYNVSFQGQYLYRSDGAAYLELFTRNAENTPIRHFVTSALGDQIQQALLPQSKAYKPTITKTPGSAALWMMSHNPAKFIYTFYFKRLRNELDSVTYDFEGWEDVDGHTTARVVIVLGASSNSRRLWVDLKRGGHVLRAEGFNGGRLTNRLHDVQLQRFTGKSGDAWLPVKATLDEFTWDAQWYDQPTFGEKVYCVNGSVVVNNSIPEASFDLKKRLKLPEGQGLRGLRKEFTERPENKPLAMDDKSIKARLDRQLQEAREQGRVLDASSTAQIEKNSANVRLYLAASVLVIAALALLYVARRRRDA